MKSKISVTLSEQTVAALDSHVGNFASRSVFIQEAVDRYLKYLEMRETQERDIAIINANAAELNREAEDVLEYQVDL